jgi:uroporphyrinogen decarboxylase
MNASKPMLDVLAGRKPKRRPIWLMRQAGRYLPEYREIRSQAGSFLKLCYNPVWASAVTLQPLRRFDLDAAILFSDILVVPNAMGLKLDFVENEGPQLQTVRDAEAVRGLKISGAFDAFDRVAETVALVKQGLPSGKTLIGFCGAPWTVASYMIEGGSSARARALADAAESPSWFGDLIDRLVDVSVIYLEQQIAAGAEVVQIFDSWAGDIPPEQRERWVTGPIGRMIVALRKSHPGFPVIVFARGVGNGHSAIARATGATAVSVEQDCDLGQLLASLHGSIAVQGNLDPSLLLGERGVMESHVRRVCAAVPMHRHIFNLGHGITPKTSPEAVTSLVSAVRDHDHV